MLEVPFLDEIVLEKTRETAHKNVVTVLKTRFGDVPRNLVEEIESVVGEEQLEDLVRSAVVCRDLAEFRRAITRG